MRTISSRFFVILLHLLGVSNHHLPSWYYDLTTNTGSSSNNDNDNGGGNADQRSRFYRSGIRGVHPQSIVLERMDLQQVGGLDGVHWLDRDSDDGSSSSSSSQQQQLQETREPFWLQDSHDGKCLGPNGGFSECGDATLWFILRRSTRRKSLHMGPFGIEERLDPPEDPEQPYRYALQIVDNDYEQQQQQQQQPLLQQQQQRYSSSSSSPESTTSQQQQQQQSLFSSWRQQRRERRQQDTDCLIPSSLPSNWQQQQQQQQQSQETKRPSLELGSCSKQKTAWSWRVDDQGILYLPEDTSRSNHRRCLQRTKTSLAVLASCSSQDTNATAPDHATTTATEETASPSSSGRLVQFSLVRYLATSSSNLPSSSQSSVRPVTPNDNAPTQRLSEETTDESQQHGSSDKGGLPITRDKAHSHANDRVMRAQPLFEMNLATRPFLTSVTRKESTSSPFAALKDSNPILFLGTTTTKKSSRQPKASSSSSSSSAPTSPGKIRRMEVHPYIAASKDEVWVDPQTGLQYKTDLCRYLGHDRKESGRHTLMGVGQFVKTMLKIKVYGIALYVSKRDVLADPSFQQYAGMTAEELRKRPDFYEKLRMQPSASEDPANGGFFDRTLFLKTNMQLSTETMRSSLESDWKLLSEESKAMLIDSSLRPRPANEQMLEEILRDDNPSRCSCSQTAPEEYNADPSCCARGIELAFTWRKNGNLEVRLNGRLMDAFPRPDIAEGIFYEYLRLDDPFSVEFIDKVVDGFPFLLSPLAQIQGVTPPVMQQSKPSTDDRNSFFKAIGGATDAISHHASGLVGAAQHGASEIVAGTVHAVQSAGDGLRHFGEEMDHTREYVWKQLTNLPQQNPAEMFSDFVAKIKGEKMKEEILNETEADIPVMESRNAPPHGRFFRQATSRWFGETLEAPDEIAPIIHPTMNKTILSLVHLYLLLLLVVSVPATNNNRTRFVVRKSCKSISLSSSEASLLKCGVGGGMEDLMDGEPFTRKQKIDSPFRDYHSNNGNAPSGGRLIATTATLEMSSQDRQSCKEGLASGQGSKQFLNRSRATMKPSMRSHSTECPSSISDGSNGHAITSTTATSEATQPSRSGSNRMTTTNGSSGSGTTTTTMQDTNDKMKKSLSYFL